MGGFRNHHNSKIIIMTTDVGELESILKKHFSHADVSFIIAKDVAFLNAMDNTFLHKTGEFLTIWLPRKVELTETAKFDVENETVKMGSAELIMTNITHDTIELESREGDYFDRFFDCSLCF